MGTVGATLDFARTQLGATESPFGSNCQKYSTYWHHPCEAWCADFACYVLQHASSLDVPMSAYTPTLAKGYQDAGRWHHTPAPGDLVFFQWPDMGRISHVGIVESVRSDGSIVTIEGNTDEAGGRTGGKVMRQVRRSNIAGYGRPKYTAPKPAPAKKKAQPTLRKGDHGTSVTRAQTALNKNGASPKLAVDGDFGSKTYTAVRAFQKRKHLTVDGVIGPETWRALGY